MPKGRSAITRILLSRFMSKQHPCGGYLTGPLTKRMISATTRA
jgi:hypothetical protein